MRSSCSLSSEFLNHADSFALNKCDSSRSLRLRDLPSIAYSNGQSIGIARSPSRMLSSSDLFSANWTQRAKKSPILLSAIRLAEIRSSKSALRAF